MDVLRRNRLTLLLGLSLQSVSGDYPCVCNFDVPLLSILPYRSDQAEPVGRLYKGECKLTINPKTDIPGSWVTIGFHNKIGYVQNSEYIRQMNCSGSPSVDELVLQPTSSTIYGVAPSSPIKNSQPTDTSTFTRTATSPLVFPQVLQPTSSTISGVAPSSPIENPQPADSSTFTRTTTSQLVFPQGHTELCPAHVKADAHHKGGFIGQYGRFCYEFVNWKRAFDGAESHCKVESGTLVSIANQHEQNFVEHFLASHKVVDKAWIGLSDKHSEGVLTWTSGVPVTYTNFQTGYSQHSSQTHETNDCFVIQNGGEWVDRPCGVAITIINLGESHPFICQYNISAKIWTFFDILPDAISVG